MAPNHIHHHGGPIELHPHISVPKQYRGQEELSNRTYPFARHFFIAQLMRVGVVIATLCAVFILGPLAVVSTATGGGEQALLISGIIFGIILVLYAIYLHFWMRKESFKFSLNYIDVCEGVFRKKEQRVLYSEVRVARVCQDMFERLGNVAHVEVEHYVTGSVLGGDQSNKVRILGLSVDQAHHLAHIINRCAQPQEYGQKK